MSIRPLALVAALAVASFATSPAHATLVTYQFSTTVNSVNPAAPSFPASLAAVQPGDPITGTLTYDTASPAIPNTFSGVFGLATVYGLLSPSFSVTIGGTTINSWSGPIDAFVWNDDVTTGTTPNDGLLYTNIISPGQLQFKLGNLILPTSTFSTESLPTTTIPGFYVFSLDAAAGDFLTSNGITNLTLLTPEPSSALLLAFIATPLCNRRRRQRS